MAERRPLRRVLGLAGWGVALGLLVVLWRWPDRILALRPGSLDAGASATCELATGPCTARFPDGLQVTLDTEPRGLPQATALAWTVALSQAESSATQLELTGVSMPMGLTLVPLERAGSGRFQGTGGLPACTAARMLWRADVRVESPTGPRLAAFEFWSERGGSAEALPPALGWDGASIPTHGELELQTRDGPLRLSDLRGRAVVVYFGYTACPDICPTTLATVGAAFRQVEPELQERVAGIMISVDPERDGLERLATYAGHFHPSIRGATAEMPRLEAMAADWGVSWRKVPLQGSGLAYAIDHSTDAWLVAPDGSFAGAIPHGTPPDQLAERLRSLLQP